MSFASSGDVDNFARFRIARFWFRLCGFHLKNAEVADFNSYLRISFGHEFPQCGKDAIDNFFGHVNFFTGNFRGSFGHILFGNCSNVLLEKMLDKAALSQRVISANVANIGTPGYRRRGVSFDEKLKKAMGSGLQNLKTTHPLHFPNSDALNKIKPEVVYVENGYWNGINNVNIDEEMVELAKNQLDFDMAATILNRNFTALRTAIRGRR